MQSPASQSQGAWPRVLVLTLAFHLTSLIPITATELARPEHTSLPALIEPIASFGAAEGDGAAAHKLPGGQEIPVGIVGGGILERAVLDQFGIQAPVGSIVQVLEKSTEEQIADRPGLAGPYCDLDLRRCQVLRCHLTFLLG